MGFQVRILLFYGFHFQLNSVKFTLGCKKPSRIPVTTRIMIRMLWSLSGPINWHSYFPLWRFLYPNMHPRKKRSEKFEPTHVEKSCSSNIGSSFPNFARVNISMCLPPNLDDSSARNHGSEKLHFPSLHYKYNMLFLTWSVAKTPGYLLYLGGWNPTQLYYLYNKKNIIRIPKPETIRISWWQCHVSGFNV